MNLRIDPRKEGLDKALPKTLRLSDLPDYWNTKWSRYHSKKMDYFFYLYDEPKEVFQQYWYLKNEAVGLKFEGTFQDDKKIDKESPSKINSHAERFLRELCARSGIFFKDIYAYWRCSWNDFHHPHFHITLLLKGLNKSKPQLIKIAKTAKRIWRRQNAAMSGSEVFDKEKGTRQRVHNYAMRTTEGIHNEMGFTGRLNRLVKRRADAWTLERIGESMTKNQNQRSRNASSGSRLAHIELIKPPPMTQGILQINGSFLSKTTPQNGYKKGKTGQFRDKMAHF